MNDIITGRVEYLRKSNGLHKQDIAKILHIGIVPLSHRYHNQTNWSAHDIEILADHFGVTTDFIFGRSNNG